MSGTLISYLEAPGDVGLFPYFVHTHAQALIQSDLDGFYQPTAIQRATHPL